MIDLGTTELLLFSIIRDRMDTNVQNNDASSNLNLKLVKKRRWKNHYGKRRRYVFDRVNFVGGF